MTEIITIPAETITNPKAIRQIAAQDGGCVKTRPWWRYPNSIPPETYHGDDAHGDEDGDGHGDDAPGGDVRLGDGDVSLFNSL